MVLFRYTTAARQNKDLVSLWMSHANSVLYEVCASNRRSDGNEMSETVAIKSIAYFSSSTSWSKFSLQYGSSCLWRNTFERADWRRYVVPFQYYFPDINLVCYYLFMTQRSSRTWWLLHARPTFVSGGDLQFLFIASRKFFERCLMMGKK